MPIIQRKDVPSLENTPAPGALSQPVVNGTLGAVSLTVTELTLSPGAEIPLHIHTGHEECMLVLEGTLEAVVGEESETVVAGTTVLAPEGVKHSLANRSASPARILAIFPTTNVQRKFL